MKSIPCLMHPIILAIFLCNSMINAMKLIDLQLHTAIEKSSSVTEEIKQLIAQKADVNSRDYYAKDNQYPLLKVGYNVQLAYYLIENKADLNCQNNKGETPFHLYCESYYIAKEIQYFIDQKANIALPDNLGKTCLHKVNAPGKIKLLIESKADHAAKDNEGNNALTYEKLINLIYPNFQMTTLDTRDWTEKLITETPIDITQKIRRRNLLDFENDRIDNDYRVRSLQRRARFFDEQQKTLIFLVWTKGIQKKIKKIIPKPIKEEILHKLLKIPCFCKSVPFFPI